MATELRPGVNGFAPGMLRVKRMVDQAAAADSRGIRFAALVLERSMKVQLSHPGTGRTYVRATVTHQASAPGESPAVDSGTLRASVGHGVVANVMRVGTALGYGADLEHGTLGNGGYIAARPWARPALNNARKEMGQVMVGELRTVARAL